MFSLFCCRVNALVEVDFLSIAGEVGDAGADEDEDEGDANEYRLRLCAGFEVLTVSDL